MFLEEFFYKLIKIEIYILWHDFLKNIFMQNVIIKFIIKN